MLRHYVLGTAFLLASSAIAQPTLTQANVGFTPGTSYPVQVGGFVSQSLPVGNNATWDFSTWTSTSNVTMNQVAPVGSAPSGTTVSVTLGGGVYEHYKSTPTYMEQLGSSSAQGFVTCSSAPVLLVFPMTMGSTSNSNTVCAGNSQGEAYNRIGTVDVEAAGWGNLVLPYGTVSNVLMVKSLVNHEDELVSDPGFPFYYEGTVTEFFKPGVKYPIFRIIQQISTPGSIQNASLMLPSTAVGMQEALMYDIGMDLYPNPASDRVEVVFGVDAGAVVYIELVDLTGKVVRSQQKTTMAAGGQRDVLDLGGLSAGVYTVRITDQHGAMGAKRLVVR